MSILRFGIVGFGHIGKKHFQHIQANTETELVSVCDIDSTATNSLENFGIKIYDNVESMLNENHLDVLCLCTPNSFHLPHALIGIEHGCHVVVEKPMALNTQDCDLLIAKAKEFNVQVFTVMQNRYAPSAQFVKTLIQKKKLGKIFQMQVNCFWNRNEQYYKQSSWRGTQDKDGGILFTQFSHFVDILYYLEGDMAEYLSGYVANYNHPYIEIEDSGAFLMRSKNGALINFNYSICSYGQNMESAFTIIAEKGTIKIGGQYLDKIEYLKMADDTIQLPQIPQIKANDYGFYQGSMNNHDKVINNVVDVLLHGATEMSGGNDGRAVVHIIESMYKTAKHCQI